MSAWTSGLSVDAFAAVHEAGFDPVGQVMGSYVHQIAYAGAGGCGWYSQATGQQYSYAYTATGMPIRKPQVAGTGRTSASRWVGYPSQVEALYRARRRAVVRLEQECRDLGGDGVVGVQLRLAPFVGADDTYEFSVVGTAVRSRGRRHLTRPFLSDLSGQDVAKLLHAGWAPCGLAFGIAVGVRHDDYQTVQALWSWQNREVEGYTDLVQRTRQEVREQIRADVRRHGGTGLVLQDMTLAVREQECRTGGGKDHVAEATLVGTSIVPFRTPTDPETTPRQVLRMDQRHDRVVGDRLTAREEEFR